MNVHVADQLSSQQKALGGFRYMSFDVVGTLIDFETSIIEGLDAVAEKAGIEIDGEAALDVYRLARQMPGAARCPDDLGRCYSVIAQHLGLPDETALQDQMIEAVAEAKPFADSVSALEKLSTHYKLIAMTNARRWGFDRYQAKLGMPFWATFTVDETGVEKPDPIFFRQVFAHVEKDGGAISDIIHTAQSQYHDIGVSRALGMTNVWIERRHDKVGYGGTLVPEQFTKPNYHFHSMEELANAVDGAFVR
jgi:putative hydrolase of the HAD superfamily